MHSGKNKRGTQKERKIHTNIKRRGAFFKNSHHHLSPGSLSPPSSTNICQCTHLPVGRGERRREIGKGWKMKRRGEERREDKGRQGRGEKRKDTLSLC